MVHVVTSEAVERALRRSRLHGAIVVWHERLYEGPIPQRASAEQWYNARATYWDGLTDGQLPYSQALVLLRDQDVAFENALDEEEVVLWADSGLADQIILVRHLATLLRDPRKTRITYVSSDMQVARRLCALAELAPHQIEALFTKRRPVTNRTISNAQRIWEAWCAEDPRGLMMLAAKDFPDLPHINEAILRHLQEYPDVAHGLSRLEFEALAVVALGYVKLVEIFVHVDRYEERPHFSDVDLWRCLNRLSQGRNALVVVSGDAPLPLWNPPRRLLAWTVGITDLGLEVVHGKRDHVAVRGLDRRLGGVHLKGNSVPWRWDASRRSLIESDH